MQGKDRLRASGGFEAFGRAATPDAKFQARLLKANRLRRPKHFQTDEAKGAVPLFAADILESQNLKRWPATPGPAPSEPSPPSSDRFDWRFSGKGRGGAQ